MPRKPKSAHEVQVILSSLDRSLAQPFRDRYLLLTKDEPVVCIGRTSKRNEMLESAVDNAWIDSAVMSRDHARLKFKADQKVVMIEDIGSLHGTFHNGERLIKNEPQPLKQGDILKFGISVERSAQAFPPCIMQVALNFGTDMPPQDKPVVFRVPDDSDVDEDMAGDGDDDFSIRNTSQRLRAFGFRPDQTADRSHVVAIDLTSDEDVTMGTNVLRDEGAVNSKADAHEHDDAKDDVMEVDGLGEPPVVAAEDPDGHKLPNPNAEAVDGPSGSSHQDIPVADPDEWADCSSVVPPAAHAEIRSYFFSSPLSCELSDDESYSPSEDADEAEDSGHESAFDLYLAPSSPAPSMPSPTCACTDGDEAGKTKSKLEDEVMTTGNADEPTDCCDPANIVATDATSEPERPSARAPPAAAPLPMLESHRGPGLDPVSLPSFGSSPLFAQEQSPESAAEVLGAKTGKFEYFSARVHNKRFANLASSESRQSAHAHADTATSALLASGSKFLHSPLREMERLPLPPSFELDETSAYQFELSKKEAAAAANRTCLPRRTHVAIDDLIDSHPAQQPRKDTASNKRKAQEISELVPEEKCASKPLSGPPVDSGRAKTDSVATAVAEAEGSRAVKRLRRAAEIFGYAALGGVAVMSALIATAPAL